jgi:myo-inositol-1(or 4)-monophosphatase
MAREDFQSLLKTASEAARAAGPILETGYENLSGVQAKGEHDVVTDTDYQSERVILEIIRKEFPGHSVRSEEEGEQLTGSDYIWYVDPLDGTANFLAGVPYFSVSIAAAHQGTVVAGVVFNPVTGEFYHASKGGGAYLGGRRIHVSTTDGLSSSIIATAFAPEEKEIKEGTRLIETIALSVRRTVINFAPALDLCNIARGRMDGLVDNGSTPEDHAGASIILQEAGGKLQNLGSNTWDVNRTGTVASNGRIHEALLDLTDTL